MQSWRVVTTAPEISSRVLQRDGLYWKLQHLYLLFRDRDYFKRKASITQRDLPDWIKHEAGVALDFQPFPITKWTPETITEDHVFDALEFLYDHVSRPAKWDEIDTGDGYPYYDWTEYDDEAGKAEFREKVNDFLCDYESG